MPKTRPPYSPEFRRQMVDLVRAGRDPEYLARSSSQPRNRSAIGLLLQTSVTAVGRDQPTR